MRALFRGEVPSDLPSGWVVVGRSPCVQMLVEADTLRPVVPVPVRRLTPDDVPLMLDLIARTEPGPFRSRTIAMGDYYGHFEGADLVSMAGERLGFEGYTEISAVCTDPGAQGRGFGSALTRHVAAEILARGEQPFLHVADANVGRASGVRKARVRHETGGRRGAGAGPAGLRPLRRAIPLAGRGPLRLPAQHRHCRFVESDEVLRRASRGRVHAAGSLVSVDVRPSLAAVAFILATNALTLPACQSAPESTNEPSRAWRSVSDSPAPDWDLGHLQQLTERIMHRQLPVPP